MQRGQIEGVAVARADVGHLPRQRQEEEAVDDQRGHGAEDRPAARVEQPVEGEAQGGHEQAQERHKVATVGGETVGSVVFGEEQQVEQEQPGHEAERRLSPPQKHHQPRQG